MAGGSHEQGHAEAILQVPQVPSRHLGADAEFRRCGGERTARPYQASAEDAEGPIAYAPKALTLLTPFLGSKLALTFDDVFIDCSPPITRAIILAALRAPFAMQMFIVAFNSVRRVCFENSGDKLGVRSRFRVMALRAATCITGGTTGRTAEDGECGVDVRASSKCLRAGVRIRMKFPHQCPGGRVDDDLVRARGNSQDCVQVGHDRSSRLRERTRRAVR